MSPQPTYGRVCCIVPSTRAMSAAVIAALGVAAALDEPVEARDGDQRPSPEVHDLELA
jgi:hypothetical protein